MFFVAVIAIEIFQARYDYYFYQLDTETDRPDDIVTGLDPLRVKVKNDDAARSGQAYDVIIIGDSSAFVALKPDEITERTGLSAYNYAGVLTDGARAPYYMLNTYLKNASRPPKYVILCLISVGFFLDGHRDGIEYTYIRGNSVHVLRDMGLGPLIKAHIPTLHHQTYFKSVFAERHRFSWPDLSAVQEEVEELRRNRGTISYYPEGEVDAQARLGTGAAFTQPVTLVMEKTLREICESTRESGSRLLILLAPSSPAQFELQVAMGGQEKILRLLRNLENEYSNVIFLDFQDEFPDHRYFLDVFHLNRSGYKKLNVLISQEIMEDLDTPIADAAN